MRLSYLQPNHLHPASKASHYCIKNKVGRVIIQLKAKRHADKKLRLQKGLIQLVSVSPSCFC